MRRAFPRDRAAVHAFVDALRAHRASFGRLRVDTAVATLALEQLAPGDLWQPGTTGVDTIAFHCMSGATAIIPDLLAN